MRKSDGGQPSDLGPTVRLAWSGRPNRVGSPQMRILADPSASQDLPALLISYVSLHHFTESRDRLCFRDWAMDSGAFSAYNIGTIIDVKAYTERALELLQTDPKLTEVFALDVIGDWRGSLKNLQYMWSRGVPAIPCFHRGEPWSVLMGLAKDYPKLALGGVARLHGKIKMDWSGQCFARVWPKRLHGFGYCTEPMLMGFPFHSVDATSWSLRPCRFGAWKSFGMLNIYGGNQNLRAEVEWHLKLERRARSRWAQEMALLAREP